MVRPGDRSEARPSLRGGFCCHKCGRKIQVGDEVVGFKNTNKQWAHSWDHVCATPCADTYQVPPPQSIAKPAMELEWLRRHGYVTPPEVGDHRYVAFSWGDKTAYVQERWLQPGQVIHALFLPSGAVMEIIPFDWNIPEVCHHQRL